MQLTPQITSLISIIIGLVSGSYLLWTLIRQHRSKNWPTTTGEILESSLKEDSDGWYPLVRYTYTVNKKNYANNRLYFYLTNGDSEKNTRKHLLPYLVGKKVSIYYHPQNPEDSVLDRRMPLWRPLFWLFFTLFWLFIGSGMANRMS